MAFYKYSKRVSTSGNRGSASKYPLQTRVNKPVKTIYKKRNNLPKTARNKSAIMTIAKQVKTLQNQRAGEVQSHTQQISLTGDQLPTSESPVLFGLNNFYDQDVYRGSVVSGVATYSAISTFSRHTYKSDLDDEYEWNARRNNDTVSLIEYKPIFTRLNMNFQFGTAGATFPSRVRVTVLKIKPYHSSNKLNVTLPTTLGAYRWLANDASGYQNFFDKTYHTVLIDRWIPIRSPPNSSQTTFSRNLRIDFKHNASILKPDISALPSGQTFWTNVPVKDQIWVLVSTDAGYLTNMRVNKFDVWRDPHGI